MPTYGLTADGFLPKPLTTIREELGAALRAAFGNSIDLGDKSIFGQIVGIVSEPLYLLWKQLEAIYSSQDPNKASGAALDAISALTGTIRPPASFSTVVQTLFGSPGTPVPTGTQFSVASTERTFETAEDVVIAAADAWATSTVYSVGDRVLADTDSIYECIVAGTSHASTPLAGAGTDITDGTVHWKLIGTDTDGGVVDVTCVATETGAITAVAGDITGIDTPIFGLSSVVNLLDASPGRDRASDQELRVLREHELAGTGQSPADAIRADILRIPGVTACTVFMNLSDYVDADGMPPHSVEALVRTTWSPGDADDQLIRDLLQQNVAAGIVTHGNVTGTAADSEGVLHTIKFSRPTTKPIYATLNVIVDSSAFPTDGADLIAEEIVAWGDLQATGKDAVASAVSARAFRVDGVLDVTDCFIDVAPAPALDTTIAVSRRELAEYDTSRIVVNVSTGEP